MVARNRRKQGPFVAEAKEHQFRFGRRLTDRHEGKAAGGVDFRQQAFELEQQRAVGPEPSEPLRIGADRIGASERLTGKGDRVHGGPTAARSARIAAGNSSISG